MEPHFFKENIFELSFFCVLCRLVCSVCLGKCMCVCMRVNVHVYLSICVLGSAFMYIYMCVFGSACI